MAKKVGLISINLQSGVAQFNTDMGKAKASIASFGTAAKAAGAAHAAASHTTVSGMQASSAAIRVMEGGMTNNLRAVERFVAGTLKLGPVLQAAFPLIGGFAFLGLMTKIGTEVYDFFKKMAEGPARVARAFSELNAPLRLTNDELALANDRLSNDIAKLEGRRQNTLAAALDEARVVADKLADSLDKDLKALNNLLKEENVSKFNAFFTNQSSTSWLKDLMSGPAGFSGVRGDISNANEKGRADFDAAKTDTARAAVVARTTASLQKIISDASAIIAGKLREANIKQGIREGGLRNMAPGTEALLWAGNNPDQSKAIDMMEGTLKELQQNSTFIDRSVQNTALTNRKNALKADDDTGVDKTDPLKKKLDELDAQLGEVTARIKGEGGSEAERSAAAAAAAAIKSIETVNEALGRQDATLTPSGEAKIRLREMNIALANTEEEWGKKLRSTTDELEEHTANYKQLAAAIGLSYEQTKKANAETAVLKFTKGHTQEYLDDPAHAGDVAKVRSDANDATDAEHAEHVKTAVFGLTQQIALEKSLAAVQSQGAEAVRLVTLAYKLRELAHKGDNAEIQKEIDLYNSQRATAVGAKVDDINIQIDATRRLSAAQIQGAEAVRQVEQQLKEEKMKRDDGDFSGPEIAASKLEEQLKRQQAITESVLKTANADRERLKALDLEEAAALKLIGSGADQLGLEIKLRDIQNERLKIKENELLQSDSALDGIKAFFAEMEQTAETSSKIILDTLNSTFDKVSGNLAKLMTGQKTDFAKMFKGIGESMLQSSIKKTMQTGLSAFGNSPLGKKLGLGGLGKKDGQSAQTALWMQLAAGQSATEPGGAFARLPARIPPSAAQAAGGVAGGLFKSLLGGFLGGSGGSTPAVSSSVSYPSGGEGTFGGMMAGGGDISADKAYIAGDEGPEIIHGINAHVMSNSDSRKLVAGAGGDHYYTIDARGTDPALTEQRTKAAIMAAHDSAVSHGFRVQQEHLKRTPQRA